MIPAIAAHLCIGVGFVACQQCGKKICPHHKTLSWIIIGGLMLAEATASVVVIDNWL